VKRPGLAVAAAGILGLTVRCLYLWQLHDAPFFDLRLGDAEAYHLWARRILAGDWLGSDVYYQAPLYPYFLAVLYRMVGEAPVAIRAVHALLGGVSCALLSYAGWRMFGRRGLLAGAILALYPAAIFLDGQLDKSALSTTLLCAVFAAFAARRWGLAGLALGLLALTRENALLLAIPLVIFAATRNARLRFTAGVVLILLPVGIRNYSVSHELHLTTAQSGPNFYIGNRAGAPGWYDPLVAGHGSAADEREDALRLAEQASGRKLTAGEVSRYWTARALSDIRSHPFDWLALLARKLALVLNNAEIADTESQSVYAGYSWLLRLPLTFGLILAAAVLNYRGDRTLWSMAAIYALSVAAFYVLARYRFPLVPILLLLAVSIPRRPSRSALAASAAALALAFLPLVDPRPARATGYYAVATAFSGDPARLDDSATFYRRALEVDPRFPGAHFGLATVLTRQGRPADAIPHFEAAVAAWPDYQEAHYNFAQALAAVGRDSAAVTQYTIALRLRPDDVEVHLALAQTLLRLDRPDEALPHFYRAIELNPSLASAHANAGAILANRGRLADAVPHFERAAALGDENARRNLEAARRMDRGR
jgi:tetratricopeptide (TPR) repeat protein